MIGVIIYFGTMGIVCGLLAKCAEFKQEEAIVYALTTIMVACFIIVVLCFLGVIQEVK